MFTGYSFQLLVDANITDDNAVPNDLLPVPSAAALLNSWPRAMLNCHPSKFREQIVFVVLLLLEMHFKITFFSKSQGCKT